MKRIAAILAAALLTVSVSAKDGNIIYDDKAKECIFGPGTEYSLTDLFPNFKGVMPGDTLEQKIYVKNHPDNNAKIKIYMRALGGHMESTEFLSQLTLRVENESQNIMFDASANESAQLSDWVCLGTLYSGGELELKVILEVPVTLDNTYQHHIEYMEGYLDWEFAVEEFPVEPDDPKPPQTGDDTRLGRYILLAVLSAAGLMVIFLLGRKKKEKED